MLFCCINYNWLIINLKMLNQVIKYHFVLLVYLASLCFCVMEAWTNPVKRLIEIETLTQASSMDSQERKGFFAFFTIKKNWSKKLFSLWILSNSCAKKLNLMNFSERDKYAHVKVKGMVSVIGGIFWILWVIGPIKYHFMRIWNKVF